MAYATYRRCKLESPLLSNVYTLLTSALVFFVLYSAIVTKDHLLQEELRADQVLFARLEESPDQPARCSTLNASGQCVEWQWLEACEATPERLFLATYVQETLHLGGPRLRPLGKDPGSSGYQDGGVWQHDRSHSFYVGDPEAWNLIIEHRLSSSLLGTWSGQDLPGFVRTQQPTEILQPRQHVMQGIPPSPLKHFGSAAKSDRRLRVKVRDLLRAVDVDLDQECNRCSEFNLTGEAAHLRRIGIELDVTLFYSNLWLSWANPATWFIPAKEVTFEVQGTSRQPVEGVRTIRTVGQSELLDGLEPGTNARVTRRTFGVRIFFHQRGIIGKLDAASFVNFLVKSLTFLTIAWSVSEVLVDATPLGCRLLNREHPGWYAFLNSQTTEDLDARKNELQRQDKKSNKKQQ
eukprot:TRINITY_DN30338_c0_g1_i1.p1 TRINITY_DN30338_c0_g1~~TRINITY_DN30338_c0_g1_i1.p1  ORF type:complete len:406 (+),score=73.57 TRINITY_DN30338_c0_g1_i1:22-1239(+)